MFSTLLSGPVAMLATMTALVLGLFRSSSSTWPGGAIEGGGPIESFVRLIRQQNVTTQLDPGLTTTIVQGADNVFMSFMTAVTGLLPDFSKFNTIDYWPRAMTFRPTWCWFRSSAVWASWRRCLSLATFACETREVAR